MNNTIDIFLIAYTPFLRRFSEQPADQTRQTVTIHKATQLTSHAQEGVNLLLGGVGAGLEQGEKLA
jgi:hypothetical protein